MSKALDSVQGIGSKVQWVGAGKSVFRKTYCAKLVGNILCKTACVCLSGKCLRNFNEQEKVC